MANPVRGMDEPTRSMDMIKTFRQRATAVVGCALMVLAQGCGASSASVALPPPAQDIAATAAPSPQSAVFAGGCFWGVEAVFRHVKGVKSAVSGYAGGTVKSPSYEQVSTGSTGHAESVKVTYDPSQVTYGQLLRVFFSVAHDPTELDRQGPDRGTQYRSAIFTTSDDQARVARAYIAQLDGAKVFASPIVTQVVALPAFYPAEAYHQNYAALHPTQPYIAFNDLPKVDHLRDQFPTLYRNP
jgi:peptide-methionine (S)-S-oxide reductase